MQVETGGLKLGFWDRVKRHRDVRFEDPGQSKLMYRASFPLIEAMGAVFRVSINGEMPESGGCVIGANHADWKDVLLDHELPIVLAGRTTRILAKRTQIDPRAQESERAWDRRTGHDLINEPYESLSPFRKILREGMASYNRQFHPIPVDIEGMNIGALRQVRKDLRAGRMVLINYQGTRRPKDDLDDDKGGLAFVVANFLEKGKLDLPIVLAGLSYTNSKFHPIQINVSEPFHYFDIPRVDGEDRTITISRFLRDKMGQLVVDPRLKPVWELRQLGMSEEQIEEARKRNPDLVSAAWLLKHTPAEDSRTPDEILKEIDSVRFY